MKYLLLIIRILLRKMRFLTGLLIGLLLTPLGAEELSKESLRSATESQIRFANERNKRLKRSELLDANAQFYYDGNKAYPGIVINGVVFPALVKNNSRQPGCLIGDSIIEGKYDRSSAKVICELYTTTKPDKGETLIIQSSDGLELNEQEGELLKARDLADRKENKISKAKDSSIKNTKPATTAKRSKGSALVPPLNKPLIRSQEESNRVRTGNKGGVLEINAFHKTAKFGVRAGTWARVFLPRAVSSSEGARIETELVEDIKGLHRNIPAGTIFFANHKVNPSTQRLDMDVLLMVLPDGSEYPVSATIHSSSMASGLAGAVITHTDRVAGISAKRNVLESTANVIAKNSNPAAQIAGNLAGDVLDAQERALPIAPNYSVQVASQEGLIRFGRSF